jgi:hypothetical protein
MAAAIDPSTGRSWSNPCNLPEFTAGDRLESLHEIGKQPFAELAGDFHGLAVLKPSMIHSARTVY